MRPIDQLRKEKKKRKEKRLKVTEDYKRKPVRSSLFISVAYS